MGWAGDLAWRDKAMHIATTLNPPGDLNRVRVAYADGTHKTFATSGCSSCHR